MCFVQGAGNTAEQQGAYIGKNPAAFAAALDAGHPVAMGAGVSTPVAATKFSSGAGAPPSVAAVSPQRGTILTSPLGGSDAALSVNRKTLLGI